MGNIIFNIIRGTEPLTAELIPSVVAPLTGLSLGIHSFTGVPEGTYILRITDNNGCLFDINGVISQCFTCSGEVFEYAHSSIAVNSQIFLGERKQDPNIIVFTDIDDLTQYQTVNIPDVGSVGEGLETVCYSSSTFKLYFSCRDNNTGLLAIIELDPNTLIYSKHVIIGISGTHAVIATDGTYIYGGNDSKFFKIRISDWTVIQTHLYSGGFADAHGIAVNATRSQVYISSQYSVSILAILDTSDLSTPTYVDLSTYVSHPTDDLTYYDDGSLCKVYVAGEYPLGIYGAASVEITAGNAIEGISLLPSYGLSINDTYIYSAAISKKIQQFDIYSPADKIEYDLNVWQTGFIPNEIIFVNDRLFVTWWAGMGVAKICEWSCLSTITTTTTII